MKTRLARLTTPAALFTGIAACLSPMAARAGDPIIAPGQKAAEQAPPAGSTAPSAPPPPIGAAPNTAAPNTPPPSSAPPNSAAPNSPPPSSAAPNTPPPSTPPAGAPTSGFVLPPAPAKGGIVYPVHPWEMEPIDVTITGDKAALREEQKIGAYRQPRWTAKRRFPTTRVYVVPAGKMEFEWWFRYTGPFDDAVKDREIRSQWEFEMGLGHRLQLDLYLVGQQIGQGQFAITREKAEVRYALADWGVLWGNPTLYLEYQHQNGEPGKGEAKPDTLEGKILLGGELASRWHAGLNVQWERELWGGEANEYQATFGVSYTVADEEFHAGVEGYAELVDEKGSYWNFKEQAYLFGPSFMWSPVRPANLLFVPLFGAGVEDGNVKGLFQAYLITGWTY